MQGLKDKYLLQVILATVFASAMIFITDNGVADAVKVTAKASMEEQQTQPLAPPGPFRQSSYQNDGNFTGNQQALAPTSKLSPSATPTAPSMLDSKQVVPVFGIASPTALKPLNTGVEQNVEIEKPVFQRKMPNTPQTLSEINMPQAPEIPINRMAPPAVAMPVLGDMPRFNHDMHNMVLQPAMPQFRGNPSQPAQLGVAPQIQQFKYIPLPVYQANFGHPQAPSFSTNVPGYWVPQMNNK